MGSPGLSQQNIMKADINYNIQIQSPLLTLATLFIAARLSQPLFCCCAMSSTGITAEAL